MTTVKEIVKEWLKENGYDGLSHPVGCACRIDDMSPCGMLGTECVASYEGPCTCGEGCEFDMYQNKADAEAAKEAQARKEGEMAERKCQQRDCVQYNDCPYGYNGKQIEPGLSADSIWEDIAQYLYDNISEYARDNLDCFPEKLKKQLDEWCEKQNRRCWYCVDSEDNYVCDF